DTVRVVDAPCPHGRWSFTVLGRTDLDFLKIPGGILRVDEILRVLRLFPQEITDRFELHWSEEERASGPRLQPTIYVEAKAAIDLKDLAERIAEHVRVAPEMTYALGVARGRYAPLLCKNFTPSGSTKARRIIKH